MEMNAEMSLSIMFSAISFWRPEVASPSGRFLAKAKAKVENLIKQLFHSRLLDMKLVIANSYPTRVHGIIVN